VAKRWLWLLLGEDMVGAALLWCSHHLVLGINYIARPFLPWLGHAVVMSLIRGRDTCPALHTPRNFADPPDASLLQ
jgi:hypothetical protein